MSVQFRKFPLHKSPIPPRIAKIIFTSSKGVHAKKATENATPSMLVKSGIVTDPAPLDPDALVGLAVDALPEPEACEPVGAAEAPVVEEASEAKSVKIWVLWYV